MKRTRIVVALATLFSVHAASAADAGMQQLFDDIGAYGNVSGPGAYRAQGVNVVTGGNIFMRAPVKNVTPLQVQLPSLRMGCGGIDLYAGSFSFINKEAFVSLMKNIGTSAVSYAFKLALDSISPQINKTLTELQQVAQEINGYNINSCEAGKALASGIYDRWQRQSQVSAQTTGASTGQYSDFSEARYETQGDDAKTNATLSNVSDTATKMAIKPGNIAWRALARMPGLDNQDRELMMSMTGTVVLVSDPKTAPDYKSAKSITIRQFIHGNGNGKVPIYRCTDGTSEDQCLKLSDSDISVQPYVTKIQAKLRTIASKFRDNAKLSDDDIRFINITGIPVYKALAVTTASPNLGLDEVWIGDYAELIAAEYANQFVIQTTQQIKTAYAQASQSVPGPALDGYKTLLEELERLRTDAREEVTKAYSKVATVNQMAEKIIYMERTLMGSLPSNLAGNLRFAGKSR